MHSRGLFLLLLGSCAASLRVAAPRPSVKVKTSYELIIAATHADAARVREERLSAFDKTDFGQMTFDERHPLAQNTTPRSPQWTGKGFSLIAAALSAKFHGKNSSATKQAEALVVNMTTNFQYNGFVPSNV